MGPITHPESRRFRGEVVLDGPQKSAAALRGTRRNTTHEEHTTGLTSAFRSSRWSAPWAPSPIQSKPWSAQIGVTEDGKHRRIHIATFAREEDAARAFDRVSIAKLGHAKAMTNFPVAEYQAEWAELEALGASATVARERQRARKLRLETS